MPSSSKEPSDVVKEIRVRRDSGHTHHRSRRKRPEQDDINQKPGEKRRTRSSGAEKSRRKPDIARPSFWRWATDAGDSIKAKPHASPGKDDEHASPRYHTERTRLREVPPLRSAKRSFSDTVTRGIRDRPLATRGLSHQDPQLDKSTSKPRPSLRRSRTTTRKEKSAAYPPSSYKPKKRERAHSSSGRTKRPSSVFGSVMNSSRNKKPVKKVECVTCMDEFPATKGAYLEYCQHYWCESCIKRTFDLSIKDIQNMPPKCCKSKPIPPNKVRHLFDTAFCKVWNAKYAEWTSKDRLYCPARGCGTWIKPEHIKEDKNGNRIYGQCSKCKRKVCPKCNGKYHPTRADCPKDPQIDAFVKAAKENGWQQCSECGTTVERTEGCNHMTCPPCGHEFCIICAAKWKTCNCPWFPNEEIERQRNEQVHAFGQYPQMRPVNFQQEMDMRREQERQDEAFARRIQMMNLGGLEPENNPFERFPDGNHNNHNHHQRVPADFIQRAQEVLAGPHDEANLEEGQRLIAEWQRLRRDNGAGHRNPPPGWPPVHFMHPVAPPQAPHAPFIRARGPLMQEDMEDLQALQARASQMARVAGARRGGERVNEWRHWAG